MKSLKRQLGETLAVLLGSCIVLTIMCFAMLGIRYTIHDYNHINDEQLGYNRKAYEDSIKVNRALKFLKHYSEENDSIAVYDAIRIVYKIKE